MITLRKATERGTFDHGWLKAAHSFSFGHYDDPQWRGFRTLRVINEDRIAPKMGFGEHPHRNMEIITYPISGAVRHKDSLGHEEDVTPGMIQHMSAGSGIRHAEFNPLSDETHLLQIWIEPREQGLAPSHTSARFRIHDEADRWHTLASPDGEGGSLTIHQDARMLAGAFSAGSSETLALGDGRHAWVQVVKGALTLNGHPMSAGDGAAVSDEASLELSFIEDTEIIVFDLA